ncbi:Zn-dependent dipeptidase, microsomal dipeptidase [Tautonia plasticadhaerens]|uniref:Uncharacterized protein n=1 Tax=Tautonia plasticadhaerens TaxID=2527974 RepID=A0A518GVL9_9BACT|nr:Zn-dependent dipeptidase, microsomal dipeptidase [Tautonia plasticadhaerens]QDV32646.1 hypothetical protein ElP_04810 [Tautonia plasticadhaerens]
MSAGSGGGSSRLVDLAVEWLDQYAGESTVFEGEARPGIRDRLGQVEGYLSATEIAVVWFGPEAGDRANPWGTAGDRMARVEAEFSGRLLAGPEDFGRLDAEPEGGLTWAVAGLRGVTGLLRTEEDRPRLGGLLDRGVRAFRLEGRVERPPSAEDDRPLRDEERSAIGALASLAVANLAGASSPMVDLAGLPPRASGEALAWIESTGAPLVPIVSLGGSAGGTIAGLRPGDFDRLRSLGGVVGLGIGRAFHPDAEALGRAIEAISARGGLDGVAIGTGYLGVEEPIAGLGTAGELLEWLAGRFDAVTAGGLASGAARAGIGRAVSGR